MYEDEVKLYFITIVNNKKRLIILSLSVNYFDIRKINKI